MTTTTQKINLNNCTHEQLFKAVSIIQTKAAAIFVKDDLRIGHNMKHMTDMVEQRRHDQRRPSKRFQSS